MIYIFSLLLSVLLLFTPGSVDIVSGQVTDTIRPIQGGGNGQCPSMDERQEAKNEIRQAIASVLATKFPTTTTSMTPMATTTPTMPTTAAMTTMPTMTDCSGPGWRRVAFINMTDTSYNCPVGLSLTSLSKRTCGRPGTTTSAGCSSTTFSVGGLPYSRVCGRMRGYQFGVSGAFNASARGIDSYYVDGVSLTHGVAGSRQHIWTFAVGISEVTTVWPYYAWPCDTAPPSVVPAFVGNDYFCESGLHSEWNFNFMLFSNDPLWDGQDCTANSTCCQFNNPPWFTKNLTSATTDDIELRICVADLHSGREDVPLELIELYVQ